MVVACCSSVALSLSFLGGRNHKESRGHHRVIWWWFLRLSSFSLRSCMSYLALPPSWCWFEILEIEIIVNVCGHTVSIGWRWILYSWPVTGWCLVMSKLAFGWVLSSSQLGTIIRRKDHPRSGCVWKDYTDYTWRSIWEIWLGESCWYHTTKAGTVASQNSVWKTHRRTHKDWFRAKSIHV